MVDPVKEATSVRLRRWLFSSAVLAAALLVQTALLNPSLQGRYPLAWAYAAVAVIATRCGSAAAIAAALVGYVVTDVLFLRDGAGARTTPRDLLQVTSFALISASIVWLTHRARVSEQLADERARTAQAAAQALEHEVCERRAAEASLRQSEARLRRLTDAMPEIAYRCDPHGHVLYVNSRWREYTGADVGEPQTNLAPVHPEDRAHVEEAWRQALRSGTAFEAEFRLRRGHDGVYHWFLSRSLPFHDDDGSIAGWLGTTVDVHESRLAREIALESESRLRLAIEGTDAGLWDQDLSSGRMLWSERTRELFGVDAGCETTPALLRSFVDPADAPQLEAALGRLQGDPAQAITAEFRVRRPAGGVRWLLTRGRSYADDSGRVVRATGLVFDITPYKQLEEELRVADRRKDEFLAVLAHELRNPLAPIRYATRLLAADTPPDMAADARRMIDRQLGHMARLLDDLLDVSRITRGVLELRRDTVDLRRIVDTSVQAARPLIESVGHRLEVQQPLTPIPVNGDATRLGQVIDNVLSNAAKYTESGGHISVEVAAQDEHAIVRVRDSGVGIAADVLPHIFELFVQGNSKAEGKAAGLGIGLALARQLVEMHGGTLDGASAGPGTGSEFTITLPRTHEPPVLTGVPAVPENVVALPRRLTVLIVDDNVDAALVLSQVLDLEGYTTHVAHDGVTATEMAELLRPQVIFLDLGMPRMNGVDAARSIRRQPWGTGIRLVALTGWGQPSDRELTRAAGFDAHLVKPVDLDELHATLHAREPRSPAAEVRNA